MHLTLAGSVLSLCSSLTLSPGLYLQVTCVINNFQQMLHSLPPPRPQRPESVLGMPMVTLPCVESPLEKLSGPQVRGGGGCEARLRSQKRGWDTHPLSLTWICCPPFSQREQILEHACFKPHLHPKSQQAHPSESFESPSLDVCW